METLPCVYCQHPAILVNDGIQIKKGLVKLDLEASHYECTVCKRTFKTNAQEKATSQSLSPHRVKISQEPDRGTGRKR